MDISVNCMGKISELALKIKEAVETVEQNNDVCMQIGVSMERLRAILSLLGSTEIRKHPTMTGPLKDLEVTMGRALKLVTHCKEKHFISHVLRTGMLSKDLSQVNQEIREQMKITIFASGVQIVQNSIMLEGSNNSHSNDDTRIEVDGKRKRDLEGREPFLRGSHDFKIFKFSEMEAAINNFSVENVIGKGGSATVYKGVLPDGFVVAIKRFRGDRSSQGDIEHYVNVFVVLPPHKNVIRLLGYCQETIYKIMPYNGRDVSAEITNMMVVEEYTPNGTLSEIINGRSAQLHWSSRFRIIQGMAQGIAHLHSNHIIHLDLKPGNILLDSNMNPMICDFEVSKILDQEVTETVTGEFMGYFFRSILIVSNLPKYECIYA